MAAGCDSNFQRRRPRSTTEKHHSGRHPRQGGGGNSALHGAGEGERVWEGLQVAAPAAPASRAVLPDGGPHPPCCAGRAPTHPGHSQTPSPPTPLRTPLRTPPAAGGRCPPPLSPCGPRAAPCRSTSPPPVDRRSPPAGCRGVPLLSGRFPPTAAGGVQGKSCGCHLRAQAETGLPLPSIRATGEVGRGLGRRVACRPGVDGGRHGVEGRGLEGV